MFLIFQEFNELKEEVKQTINELPKKKRSELNLENTTKNMTQYYVYLLNESSVGMYFTHFLQKKVIQENFQKNVFF